MDEVIVNTHFKDYLVNKFYQFHAEILIQSWNLHT